MSPALEDYQAHHEIDFALEAHLVMEQVDLLGYGKAMWLHHTECGGK